MMRIEIGSPVECSNGRAGEIGDVVVDPRTRVLTHLVLVPHHRHSEARLVPIGDVSPDESSGHPMIDCTVEDLNRYPFTEERVFVALTAPIETEEGWDVGVERVLAMPYFTADYGIGDIDENAVIAYDRIPKDEVEIRRTSAVTTSDGHHAGSVDGFVVDDTDHITHVVLHHGHLWGKREVAIPIGLVARVGNDEISLRVTKDEVEELPDMRIRRPA
jgi:sporulation protein YlmC with PRC-barrel domain